jgi:serine/threonine protein kinase/tetratricopeptide (TPR) repeat protein
MPDQDSLASLTAALSDRYRIERELGAGGMATVYLAHDLRHERKVAVKVLRGDLAASLGPDRFHREIRVAAALQHPHIVPLYDSGAADGRLFYVMPYVEGQSLRQKLMKAGELPVADAVRILRDVADALTEAHRHGVVHRDLKPENVMLSGRHALVTDFGVAKAVSESTGRQTLTTLGVALGTPSYMAPEQATADPNTDHRADIYAFGVLAYELLAGRTPFRGGSPQEVLAAHVTQAAEPVTNVRPADRWQNAEELIPALESAITPSGGLAPTSAVAAAPGGGRSTRRWVAAAAGAVILAVVAFGAWRAVGGREAGAGPVPNRIVVAWFDNQTADPSLDDVGALTADWIIEGLAAQQFGELVSSTEVREFMGGELATSTSRARDLASRTGAGVLVSGAYYKRGDAIEYRAEVLDLSENRLIGSVGPFRGSADATAPLDSLFQGVAVYVGDKLVMNATPGAGGDRARNLAAWRAYATGADVFVRSQAGSVEHMYRAIEHDPGWLRPYGTLWAVHINAGRAAQADSVLAVAALVTRQGEIERAYLDYMKAVLLGNDEGAYRAQLRISERSPREGAYLLALNAARTGRSAEALQAVALRDTTYFSREWSGWNSVHRWALHHLERFEEEFAVAHDIARTRGLTLGTANSQVRALAALGRAREVDSLLASIWTEPRSGTTSPGDLAATAGMEYLAHGRAEQAPAMFQRALDWHLSRPLSEHSANSFMSDLAYAHLGAGQYAEALAIFDSLSQAQPDNIGRLGAVGYTAAAMDNRALAQTVEERLAGIDRPYVNGVQHLWRSRIAGRLGDCNRAVELLRLALRTGVNYNGEAHHWYASLGRASECPALREALEPRG